MMKISEVTKPVDPEAQAIKQRERSVKKQKANLQIQKALKQYRKIAAAKPTPPIPSSRH